MAELSKIVPCLWFDTQAEDAAKLYVSVFGGDSRIDTITRYGKEGFEIHKRPEGSVLTVAFRLHGHAFTALNGGPQFKFDEAVSFQIMCDDQAEVDHFWSRFTEGGGREGPCGWLKDRFGLSWQVVPRQLIEMLTSGDGPKVGRVTNALLQMKKFDIAALQQAYEG